MAKASTDSVLLEENNSAHGLMETEESFVSPQDDGDVVRVKRQGSSKCCTSTRLTVALIVFMGIACLIIGIALISLSRVESKCEGEVSESASNRQLCESSQEAERIGLKPFMKKVGNSYRKLHPNAIIFLDSNPDAVRREFRATVPTPSELKRKTDIAFELLREFDAKDIDQSKLDLRERKEVSQIRFFLKSVFGNPYDANYYSGDWMLGPNFFCWQPICFIGNELATHLHFLVPRNLTDLSVFRNALQSYKEAILQYIKNFKFGVKAGMVGSVEECKAGLDALKDAYRQIYNTGKLGILQETFVAEVLQASFIEHLRGETQASLEKVRESVRQMLVDNLGLPLEQLFDYLKGEHMSHCVSSNVSSGLATRPLSFVYVDLVANKSNPTTRRLPTGELIQGTRSYANILSFFTSTDITPEEVYQKGKVMVNRTYSQILKLAKEVTGKSNVEEAVDDFKRRLHSHGMYFNDAPIPANESGAAAHNACSSENGAKVFCPKRWEALQKWFKASREAMGMLDPKTQDMFYFTGRKKSTPSCPVSMVPDFNPSSASQTYRASDKQCNHNCRYSVPFFMDNLGPVFSEWTVNAHEARPGHHTQVQGFKELFSGSCGGFVSLINQLTPFVAFGEGWGLYAETLILNDTDAYKGNPLQKYGALKWQLWRALRLMVDAGLHYKNMTRAQALKLFADYAWDTTDVARKEVTRYQSGPGQATAYMIGQLTIQHLRRIATEKLNNDFDLKEFHYQVLSQGSAPLSYLTSNIDEYIKCKLEPNKPGCHIVLGPPINEKDDVAEAAAISRPKVPYERKYYF